MPVFQRLVDFPRLYHQLRQPPLFVNDIVNASEEEKESVRDLITTRYNTDMLSIVPTCQCGCTKGEYAVGVLCRNCHGEVKPVVEEDIEPLLWFRSPNGVAPLINPIIWTMLKQRFRKSGFNVVQWICDPTYRSPVKQPPLVDVLIATGIQRSYNYFYENFDQILAVLFGMKDFRLKRGTVDYTRKLIEDFRHCIFTPFLPMPNRSVLVIEKTNVGVYIDPNIVGAIDAIGMITSIDSPLVKHTEKVKQIRTIKAITKLSEFYDSYRKTNLSSKPGIYRKHIFATRTHFSFRAVITSLTGVHEYDELHIPWNVGLNVLRPHVLNKLMKRGFDLSRAISFINAHAEKFHQTLADCFEELFAESEDNCFWCLEQRNPTLLQGSAQLKRITRVKYDVRDKTVSTSILTVKAPNSDRHFSSLLILK